MIQFTLNGKLLKKEERELQSDKGKILFLKLRFLYEAEFIDFNIYYSETKKDFYLKCDSLNLGDECLLDIGLNLESKLNLKLLDLAVIN